MTANNKLGKSEEKGSSVPVISLPKGGGAIRGIGEKFDANPVTGTGSMTVPITVSAGRSGFEPQLSLSYDSGAGNGPFGFGWGLSLPFITRKTDKGLPKYQDTYDSDVFILSGAEDLVPILVQDIGGQWVREVPPLRTVNGVTYSIQPYRPRVEGLFARIERWTNQNDPQDTFWRSISKDNITTWYGKTADSRIADPVNPMRVFSWLICESYNDKGNAMLYQYIPEDSAGIDLFQASERNRTKESRRANRFLKRIKYGNLPSRLVEPNLSQMSWLFEVVFDYDEGHYDEDTPDNQGRVFARAQIDSPTGSHWPVRQDPFSTYRAGFEIRTYRLCRRVLMFHHFPDELGTDDYLVRSTEFTYNQSAIASFITGITQSGYVLRPDGRYLKKSLPPLEFEFSKAIIHDEVREIDAKSLENLPYGLDGTTYQLLDLDGEGISGILTEQADGWFYKRNLSPINLQTEQDNEFTVARFAALEWVATRPSLAAIGSGQQQFLDLAGDGNLDLVELNGPTPGFFERTQGEGWESFKPFSSLPVLDWGDPNLMFVDLTGDGHIDILISEDDAFTWYPSLAEAGFAQAEKVGQTLDEEKGPRLVFTDGTQSIHMADITGDGLTDIVRIRNGEVCYWPNLGYGRFGAKVIMDKAPWFDTPDLFDHRRVRLADIDGSGIIDIIYLGCNGVTLYFNESGNSWSDGHTLKCFPKVDDLASIQAADLLGNGTACLVWSSPLPGNVRHQMRYIDLMGGQKPHLLVRSYNNLGAETEVQYASSTKFYLQDKLAGKPWITKLPFPVQVVERVETYDRISHNRFVVRYAYHHGYFDGVEREFRGFGMVEQTDTEELAALSDSQLFPSGTNIDASSHVPPVQTRTWFHNGIYLDHDHISNFFAGLLNNNDLGEYYREPGIDDAQARALLLDDVILPDGLTEEEEREACRALNGTMLRREVYALDGTGNQEHPYLVTEQNMTVRLAQPKGENRHAVFFTHVRESVNYHYERNPHDPRVIHTVTLEVDAFGKALKSADVSYGRRMPDPSLDQRAQSKQSALTITYTENDFTNSIQAEDDYRAPLVCESRTYELTGLELTTGTHRFSFDELQAAGTDAVAIEYEEQPQGGVLQKRLIEHMRTLYRRDDLTAALPHGQMQSLGLTFETYKLAYTPGLITQVYDSRVNDLMLAKEGGYVHSEGDNNWWIPSGKHFYSEDPLDTPSTELTIARSHFFLPHRFLDPFGSSFIIDYDGYDLSTIQTLDPLGNTAQAQNDYRCLQPILVTDPNGNRANVSLDALGMVVGNAVMGKEGDHEGDTLENFDPDLTDAVIVTHLQNPFADPHSILQRATTRVVYDLYAYMRTKEQAEPQGVVTYALTRETHDSELAPGEQTRIQHYLSYSDGFGREIQQKVQAEPGPLLQGGAEANPRWVGSGWTIFNNKGKPVRRYEPFFSMTHAFEFAVTAGVGPILFYDPIQRAVAGLNPNHTYTKVVFNVWKQEAWDVNDTILQADPKDDVDVGDFFRRLPDDEYLPGWYANREGGALGTQEQAAALKTAMHADTPTVTHFDSLGRPMLTIAHNRMNENGTIVEKKFLTRVELDIENNLREVIDANERIVMRYEYDMLSDCIYQSSMEAGERWTLNNVGGKPIHAWDTRGNAFRSTYDPVQRPIESHLRQGNGPEIQIGRFVYGESQPTPEVHNLRGKRIQLFDQAGIITTNEYDFKGNAVHNQRQLAREYKTILDWSSGVALESETLSDHTKYDALNRPLEIIAPDKSVIQHVYNESNLLKRLHVYLHGGATATSFVSDVNYNAKGQRTLIVYGNGVQTEHQYDPLTFRLNHLETRRGADVLQDLHYTYDPLGNITHIRDDAQQTNYFNNQVVTPDTDYTYDAVYRLIEAIGREHIGQVTQPDTSWSDSFRTGYSNPQNGQSMRSYREQYEYDAVGCLEKLIHQAANGNWTRMYTYHEPSQIETGKHNNRLSSTVVGSNSPETYTFDVHGNMTKLGHLPLIQWDYLNQLHTTAQQVFNNGTPETTYYVYDASGQRVRKVTERAAVSGQVSTRKTERIYMGGFEVHRDYEHDGNTVKLERETLHIMGAEQRIALVETRTQGSDQAPKQIIRYQFSNHLGSAGLELDEQAQIISYEEYYPYGSTSYQAVRSQTETPKHYRYNGKERDEETGLNYHGARYYAPWLGRWVSADPIGIRDGVNVYQFAQSNPIMFVDLSGRDSTTVSPGSGIDVSGEGWDWVDLGGSRDEYGTYWYADEAGTVWAWRDEDSRWTLITSASDAINVEEQSPMWPKFTKPGFWTRINIFAKIDRHMKEADALDRGDYDNPIIKGKYTQEELDQIEGIRKWQRRLDTWSEVMYQPEVGVSEWAGIFTVSDDVRAAAMASKTESTAASGTTIAKGVEIVTPAIGRAAVPSGYVRVYRFCDVTNPMTMMPSAATTSELAANTGAGYLADPMMRELRAEAHAAFGVTEESPYISVLTDVKGALTTTDPTLRTIATGFPGVEGVQRAPFLAEFIVPESLLYTPRNALSAGETELLFFGPDLTRYIVGAIPNPYFH